MTDWQSDLLAALAGLETGPIGEGMTTEEIAQKQGWSKSMADNRIRALWRAGRIECCRKFIQNRAGCMQSVPAYRAKA
jgi:predicted transcriptional regulator